VFLPKGKPVGFVAFEAALHLQRALDAANHLVAGVALRVTRAEKVSLSGCVAGCMCGCVAGCMGVLQSVWVCCSLYGCVAGCMGVLRTCTGLFMRV
jgi:hypothetical protein